MASPLQSSPRSFRSSSSTGSDSYTHSSRASSERAGDILNSIKEQTTGTTKRKIKRTKLRSQGKENKHGRGRRQTKKVHHEHKIGIWSVAYMAIVGLIAFGVSTIIGLRTKLAILEHYSSARLEGKGLSKTMTIWGTAGFIITAVTLVLSLIFSFLLMESARWRQQLAIRTVLVSYPIGVINGLIFARNYCQAAGLRLSDCSGTTVGLFLLSFVIMILSKMLYLILKDVIGWEEIEV